MGLIIRLIREILLFLSEIEARLSTPNNPIYFRKLFLKFAKVKHERNLWIGRGFRLAHSGNLILGQRCAIGAFSRIENNDMVLIGDDFLAASGLTIVSGTHDPITLLPQKGSIRIGDRVWCGVNVTIIAGVTIGNDVVLGAGSLICSDIPSNTIAFGVPATHQKHLDRPDTKNIWTWAI